MLHGHVHAACHCPWCMPISMLHVHVHGACLCPCCTFMSMLHVHVHAACVCPCCMPTSKLHVHVHAASPCPCQCPSRLSVSMGMCACACVPVLVCACVQMPECQTVRYMISPVLEWKKLAMPGPIGYQHFFARYQTEMMDPGMPMPALVSSMPMPSFGFHLILPLSRMELSILHCNYALIHKQCKIGILWSYWEWSLVISNQKELISRPVFER